MKKIAFISLNDHVPWGGSEVFWTTAVNYLLEENKYIIAISPRHWGNGPDEVVQLINNGAKDFRRKKKAKGIITRIIKKIGLTHNNRDEFRILTEFRPDLIFISLGDHLSGWQWTHKCNELGIPYIVILQLVKDGVIPENRKRYENIRAGLLSAKNVFVTSIDNLRILQRQFADPFNHALLINNPIRSVITIPAYPVTDQIEVAVVAALNTNHKGQDLLLEVLKKEKWKNRKIHFNFFGEGPHHDHLLSLKALWSLDNITFHGKKRLEEIWDQNQILLLPSRMEGLSLAFLEAMNCERPAIITDLGDTSRFITNGENGFIIPAPTVKCIDQTLELAWERREEWKAMGIKAKVALNAEINCDPVRAFTDQLDKYLE